MKGKKLLATLAVSAVLFAGCGLKSGETIITVNDTKITQGQFDEMLDKQANNGMVKALGIDVKSDILPEVLLVSRDTSMDMDKSREIIREFNKRLWEKKLLR